MKEKKFFKHIISFVLGICIGISSLFIFFAIRERIPTIEEKIGDEVLIIENDHMEFEEIPFTRFQDGDDIYTLDVDTEHMTFRLNGKENIIFPAQFLPLKVITIDEKKYIFCKKLFDEATCLLELSTEGFAQIDLPDKFKEFIFRDAVFYNDRLESSLFFVVYNTEVSTNQLYKFEVSKENGLEYKDEFCIDLNLGDNNVDENVRMVVSNPSKDFSGNKGLFILGTQYYYTYQTWIPYTLNYYPYDYNARLIEVYDEKTKHMFLTQSSDASMMFLYDMDDKNNTKTMDITDTFVTATINENTGNIESVSDPKDLIKILEKDITSMQCSGIMEMGSNNLEGRVPWAQVYYLNGLTDFLMPEFTEKIQVPGYSAFQDRVRQRLKIEMDILEQLVHSKKSLVSKRYNLNRELHDCALHYDRVMQLFCRYYRVIGKKYNGFDKMIQKGLDYEGTVEKVLIAEQGNADGVTQGNEYLIQDEGGIFEKTVAPYNYMSAYVSNVCVAEQNGYQIPRKYIKRAENFISILLSSDNYLDYDTECLWPYYYGMPYVGWEDRENNTIPYFNGQTYDAHISYRSMDAVAIIYASKVIPQLYDEKNIEYLKEGVENGKLYPFVNEALIESGYSEALIPFENYKEWIRPHHDWNIQNTAWAYYFLLQ